MAQLAELSFAYAGIAAVSGTIAARVAMGAVCDWIGPRLGMSSVLMMTAPCVFGMALANKALDFILLRFGIGFGLSTFVSCQFWTASMFNVKIVGALLRRCAQCIDVPARSWYTMVPEDQLFL